MGKIFELKEVDSTNSWIERNLADLGHGDTAVALSQTAGRGQRGNSWEAEPGKNLLFSMFVHTGIDPNQQFLLSESVCLAVATVVRQALAEAVPASEVKVKWPNDVYVGDRKIAGILIQNGVGRDRHGNATLHHSIIGVGLNVNQTEWSEAVPNPVSLAMLAHKEFSVPELFRALQQEIMLRIENVNAPFFALPQHEEYLRSLWRHDGQPHLFAVPADAVHPFHEGDEVKETFEATILDVDLSGMLTLSLPDGQEREYTFKEVTFILGGVS